VRSRIFGKSTHGHDYAGVNRKSYPLRKLQRNPNRIEKKNIGVIAVHKKNAESMASKPLADQQKSFQRKRTKKYKTYF
jgi:hypothetical protein